MGPSGDGRIEISIKAQLPGPAPSQSTSRPCNAVRHLEAFGADGEPGSYQSSCSTWSPSHAVPTRQHCPFFGCPQPGEANRQQAEGPSPLPPHITLKQFLWTQQGHRDCVTQPHFGFSLFPALWEHPEVNPSNVGLPGLSKSTLQAIWSPVCQPQACRVAAASSQQHPLPPR